MIVLANKLNLALGKLVTPFLGKGLERDSLCLSAENTWLKGDAQRKLKNLLFL